MTIEIVIPFNHTNIVVSLSCYPVASINSNNDDQQVFCQDNPALLGGIVINTHKKARISS